MRCDAILSVLAFVLISAFFAPAPVAAGGGGIDQDGVYFKDNAKTGFYPHEYGTLVEDVDTVCGPYGECYCQGWDFWKGSKNEKSALTICKWIVFSVCVVSLIFFAYEFFTATCGWEETYVCCIELVHVCFSIWKMTESPAMLYLSTGNIAQWLRYAEWLLSCPVILIHLSNLTGMKNDYNKRTMALLVSDVGCIVWGTTAAMAHADAAKIIFFFVGLLHGAYTYYAAAKIYIEAYHTVPKGICRTLVKLQAYDYFLTWSMFPILFMLGPEGFNKITLYTSAIAHEILDLFSKNLWGLLGHFIRERIHHHILVHGNITKKTKMTVGGEEVEIETYIDEEEATDPENDEADIVDNGTKDLANRQSFVMMRKKLEKKGVDVRASLGDEHAKEMDDMRMQAGRVILCVPDQSLVTFFQEQFSLLPAPIEVVPALGMEVGMQLAQQALSIGGPTYVDYILVHPEFLQDRSPGGFLGRSKMIGMRVAAFGMVPQGAHRELIEACGTMLDGYIDGPSFQSGFNPQQLVAFTARMQALKRMGGGMYNGGMGGMNSMGGMGGMPTSMGGGMGHQGSMMGQTQMGMMGSQAGMMMPMGQNPMGNGMNGSMMGGGMGQNGMGGMNGSMMGGGVPPSQATSVTQQYGGAPMAAASPNEAEMLTQLMGEISRLKSELGDQA